MKILRVFLILLSTLVIWLGIRQYLFCPRFSFVAGQPFSGDQLYNPYTGLDSGNWVKCNFHAHTYAWNGFTNGHGTAADLWKYYDSLGYAVHCVSNYQDINTSFNDRENYIPSYEHGYNIKKTHELVLGSHSVEWLDYVFPQTCFNKQHILDKLSENNKNLVILNHPSELNGFTKDDLQYLGNYNCIEVLNTFGLSFDCWEAALSAGKPVFIIGDDDAHNACNVYNIGRCCTWVDVSSVNGKNVITALRSGKSYGMLTAYLQGEGSAERIKRLRYELPVLKKFSVKHDTIELAVSAKARQIQFIGQQGTILSETHDTDKSIYIVKQQDTYVRTNIEFEDGTAIFLNPVFRYSGSPFSAMDAPVINTTKTFFFSFCGLAISMIWIVFVFRLLFAKLLAKERRRQIIMKGDYPVPV